MNADSNHEADKAMRNNLLTAWVVGSISLALWVAFTPYVALEQARQLALCLATLCGFCVISAMDRVKKKISLVRMAQFKLPADSVALETVAR